MSRIKRERIQKHSPHLLGRHRKSPPFNPRLFFFGFQDKAEKFFTKQKTRREAMEGVTSQDGLMMAII